MGAKNGTLLLLCNADSLRACRHGSHPAHCTKPCDLAIACPFCIPQQRGTTICTIKPRVQRHDTRRHQAEALYEVLFRDRTQVIACGPSCHPLRHTFHTSKLYICIQLVLSWIEERQHIINEQVHIQLHKPDAHTYSKLCLCRLFGSAGNKRTQERIDCTQLAARPIFSQLQKHGLLFHMGSDVSPCWL